MHCKHSSTCRLYSYSILFNLLHIKSLFQQQKGKKGTINKKLILTFNFKS